MMVRQIVRVAMILGMVFTLAGCSVTDRRTPVVRAVERALPCVVNIGTERMVRTLYNDPQMRARGDLFDQFFKDFFGPPPVPGYQLKHSLGSGVIVDSNGYILTNYHVIERASLIRVMLADGSSYDAQFLAGDEISDLALIKIETESPLPSVPFAKDDDVLLGETVITLGNPFGLTHTVTVGVLSAKNREARHGDQVLYRDILQTDAAVNPGNSGGPLLNIRGELIGINVAVFQEAQNIGFAVPVKRSRLLLARWFSPRTLKKTWLGFEPKMEENVLMVKQVSPDLARTGELQENDVIVSVNGKNVKDLYALNKNLIGVNKDDKVKLQVRRNGHTRNVELAMQDIPKPSGVDLARNLLGLEFGRPEGVSNLSAIYPIGMSLKNVINGSPAAAGGLRPGLLITRINDHEITTMDDVALALENVREGDVVTLVVVNVVEKDSFIVAQTSSVQVRTY